MNDNNRFNNVFVTTKWTAICLQKSQCMEVFYRVNIQCVYARWTSCVMFRISHWKWGCILHKLCACSALWIKLCCENVVFIRFTHPNWLFISIECMSTSVCIRLTNAFSILRPHGTQTLYTHNEPNDIFMGKQNLVVLLFHVFHRTTIVEKPPINCTIIVFSFCVAAYFFFHFRVPFLELFHLLLRRYLSVECS